MQVTQYIATSTSNRHTTDSPHNTIGYHTIRLLHNRLAIRHNTIATTDSVSDRHRRYTTRSALGTQHNTKRSDRQDTTHSAQSDRITTFGTVAIHETIATRSPYRYWYKLVTSTSNRHLSTEQCLSSHRYNRYRQHDRRDTIG
jgi:hypothetical protein